MAKIEFDKIQRVKDLIEITRRQSILGTLPVAKEPVQREGNHENQKNN